MTNNHHNNSAAWASIRADIASDRAKMHTCCTQGRFTPVVTGLNRSSLDMHGSEPYCADVRFTVQAEGVHHA